MTTEEEKRLKNAFRTRRWYQKHKNAPNFQERHNNPNRVIKGVPLTEYQRDWRKQQIAWFEEYKATLKCINCSEATPCCLDFHHTGSLEKEQLISKAVYTQHWSKKRVLAEIDKCFILCTNCHRKLHKGLLML